MKHLIDKSVLIAEIEKRIKGLRDCHADTIAGYAGEISGLERLLSFLDTLEVKEVDSTDAFINKACEWLKDNYPYYFETDIEQGFVRAMKGE